ncbi:hypothetical protein PARPLA_01163 [Rhodobacteraceae bacterium THAF1]|uniref:hypothetical protein n=1 Tax=Palleronia sp. THAF1 TaxID=2587842 RepID=UPI000F40B837|nr:hypothetical protein [Palleronia sp. THAF1]QFU07314.1 hypothetical protein FIU81_01365 [Palleronia sp. THAF1]VDC20774.1 hypothetical protein PARPLA_01163 [Rhodobacteraceae bacterium THAF1]
MLKPILLGAVVALSGLSPAVAQIARTDLADAAPPAEIPPSSYTARQYIDSAGCVYVRAGQGATSIWVPRVTGNRKALCGFQPTLGTNVASAAPVIPDPVPSPQTRVASVAPTPQVRTAAVEPSAAPTIRQTRRVAVAPVPQAAVPISAPAPVATAGRYVPPTVTAQLTPKPYGGTRLRQVATTPRPMPTQYAAPTRYVPPTVTTPVSYGGVTSLPPVKPVRIPPGYRAAWDDGRLNPYAGAQTLEGALQTAQVWTQTTPRELKKGPSVNNYVLVQPSQYGRLKPYVSGPQRQIAVPTTVYPYPEQVPPERIYGTRR